MHKNRLGLILLFPTAFVFAALVAFVTATSVFAQAQSPKCVYIVQSYERGHVCGEPQAEGIVKALAAGGWTAGRNLSIKYYWMDTYRTNATPDAMREQGQKALEEIEAFKPDIVFALDDAAAGQVMMPLVGRPDIALVFSGMNGQPEDRQRDGKKGRTRGLAKTVRSAGGIVMRDVAGEQRIRMSGLSGTACQA